MINFMSICMYLMKRKHILNYLCYLFAVLIAYFGLTSVVDVCYLAN